MCFHSELPSVKSIVFCNRLLVFYSRLFYFIIICFYFIASDVILSHMITYFNEKVDWKLRSEFFHCIVGVAIYIGWQSATMLQPIIEQVSQVVSQSQSKSIR